MPKTLSHKARQSEHDAELRAEVLQNSELELRSAAIKFCSLFVLDKSPNLGYGCRVLSHEGRARGVGCGGGIRF
jgi:hypothetical protein